MIPDKVRIKLIIQLLLCLLKRYLHLHRGLRELPLLSMFRFQANRGLHIHHHQLHEHIRK